MVENANEEAALMIQSPRGHRENKEWRFAVQFKQIYRCHPRIYASAGPLRKRQPSTGTGTNCHLFAISIYLISEAIVAHRGYLIFDCVPMRARK